MRKSRAFVLTVWEVVQGMGYTCGDAEADVSGDLSADGTAAQGFVERGRNLRANNKQLAQIQEGTPSEEAGAPHSSLKAPIKLLPEGLTKGRQTDYPGMRLNRLAVKSVLRCH